MRLIFVSGAERTGTTLVQRVLCTSSQAVPVLGELPIINALLASVSSAGAQFDFFYKDYFHSIDILERAAYKAILELIQSISEDHPGRDVLVLKSPGFMLYIRLLRKLFPQAHFVVVRRNPLDTISSLREVAISAKEAGVTLQFAAEPHKIDRLTTRFLSFYDPIIPLERRDLAPISYVRYEGLVRSPQRCIAALGSQVGLRLKIPDESDQSLGSTYVQPNRPPLHSPYWSALYRSKVSDQAVGRYAANLSPEDVQLVLARTKAYCLWAGYEYSKKEVA